MDNILVGYETMEWAWQGNQDMIFVKVDFAKVHKMYLSFMFATPTKLGISNNFLNIVRLRPYSLY